MRATTNSISVRLLSGLAIAAGLLAAGCASKPSVTENQCLAGDWETIGYSDGLSGYDSTRLLAHQQACGSFGVVPQRRLYLAGWEDGIARYCTPRNGFSLGEDGAAENRACADNADFIAAYDDGRSLYLARWQVTRVNKQIRESEQRLDQIKDQMTASATAQLDPALTVKERIDLVAQLENLADERGELKAELPRLYAELEERELALEQLADFLALATP